jgi:hypothetical protein
MILLTAALVAAFVQEASRAPGLQPPDALLRLAQEVVRRIYLAWCESRQSWHDWKGVARGPGSPFLSRELSDLPVELLDAAGNRIVLWLPGQHAVLKIDFGELSGTLREVELWELIKDDPWWTDRLVPILASGRVGDGAWSVSPAVQQLPGVRLGEQEPDWPEVYQLQEDLEETGRRFRLDDIGFMNIGIHEGRPKALDFEHWEPVRQPKG